MDRKGGIELGQAQETLLVPLYARALESRKARLLVRDPRAAEIVDSIDYDFARFKAPHWTGRCCDRRSSTTGSASSSASIPAAASPGSAPG